MNKIVISKPLFTLLLVAAAFFTSCNDNSQESTTQTDTTQVNKDTTTSEYNPAQAPVTNSQY